MRVRSRYDIALNRPGRKPTKAELIANLPDISEAPHTWETNAILSNQTSIYDAQVAALRSETRYPTGVIHNQYPLTPTGENIAELQQAPYFLTQEAAQDLVNYAATQGVRNYRPNTRPVHQPSALVGRNETRRLNEQERVHQQLFAARMANLGQGTAATPPPRRGHG